MYTSQVKHIPITFRTLLKGAAVINDHASINESRYGMNLFKQNN